MIQCYEDYQMTEVKGTVPTVEPTSLSDIKYKLVQYMNWASTKIKDQSSHIKSLKSTNTLLMKKNRMHSKSMVGTSLLSKPNIQPCFDEEETAQLPK